MEPWSRPWSAGPATRPRRSPPRWAWTARSGPGRRALGLDGALWACAVLTLLLAALAVLVPEVRRLSRAATPAEDPVPALTG
ncbi:hypothetical protein GCM10009760_57320 [Kitasatospora kazusensis]|uniref:Uncharacterized protein n=1 Tax=Kitasatospora kazusensis TaxID=407974 RepID=A0ABN3A8S6_9ACTN